MADAGPSTVPPALADAAAPIDRARHPSGIVPTLQNVVATVNLDCKLDLKNIALHARNAEYNPKVSMRERERGGVRLRGGRGARERVRRQRPFADFLSHASLSLFPFSASRP